MDAWVEQLQNSVNTLDKLRSYLNVTAEEERARARGSARTAPSSAAKLGYPFRFVRITENRNF